MVFRDKDRDFVRVLLDRELVNARKLLLRIGQLPEDPADPDRRRRLETWLERTLDEFGRAARKHP